MRNFSDESCRENQNTHFMFKNVSRKSCILWDNVNKNCRTGQATDDNMAQAHCMLGTLGYRHTLSICNTYCFSTATMVAGRRFSVTYIAYLRITGCITVAPSSLSPLLTIHTITAKTKKSHKYTILTYPYIKHTRRILCAINSLPIHGIVNQISKIQVYYPEDGSRNLPPPLKL